MSDNELIAEFMGFTKTGTFYEAQGVRYDKYKSPDFGFTYPAEWAFDRKWDWLMPVVEKIESLGFKFTIHNDAAIVERTLNRDFKQGYHLSSIADTKIMATNGVVIQFIKWYKETTDQTVQ